MAHPLEFRDSTTTFSVYEAISMELTALARELSALCVLTDSDDLKAHYEHMRSELFIIRGAIERLDPKEAR